MLRGVLPLLIVAGAPFLPAYAKPLELYWIDVEGGAATLIVTPAGESILIDTGMPGGRDPQRIVQAAKEAKLDRIDHLLTTHFHLDHFGGAAEVAAKLPIGTIYDNGIPDINPDNPTDKSSFERSIKPYREIKSEKRVVLKPGEEIPLKQAGGGPAVKLRCLAGMQKTITSLHAGSAECSEAKEKTKDTGDNANSVVVLLSCGEFEMFDGGDLTWNTEAKLVCPQSVVSAVDIYDVNHHGLDVSNNPILVHTLQPTVAIMSNGTTKGCGAETFATLKGTPSIKAIYQIHRNLRPDSENNTVNDLIANLDKDCQANYIKVTVAEDSKSYTVSIPAKHHSQTFQSR
jgi:competence protein ComEC